MINNRLRRATAAGAAAATMLTAGLALAQQGRGMFERADENGDGKVTREEIVAFAQDRVNMLDADGDGAFTEKDLRNWVNGRINTVTERRFQQRDPNGDGRITKQEFTKNAQRQQAAERMFGQYDANGDGAITPREMTRMTQQMVERRRQQQREQSQDGRDMVGRNFASLDLNGDGKVTRKEAETRSKRMFGERDANDDGVLTQEETRRSRGQGQGQQ